MEAPVRIENRAQLIYLLTEAAELEHGIMCCYLFSAFSIKKEVSEGVTEEQLAVMDRWRRAIMQVATEEMTHMALACNLLTAVGGKPHTRRPNLPSSPRAYPPTFRLGLLPFSRETLESFIFLERPEEENSPHADMTGRMMRHVRWFSSTISSPVNANTPRWVTSIEASKTGSNTWRRSTGKRACSSGRPAHRSPRVTSAFRA